METQIQKNFDNPQGEKVNLIALLGTVPAVMEIPDPEWYNFEALYLDRIAPDLKTIFVTVSNYFNIDPAVAVKKTRKREIVQVRQVSMYFAKKYTKCSLATIGNEYGGKDHATVLHAVKTVNNLIDTDKRFKRQVWQLNFKLKTLFGFDPDDTL